jgi:hypothetical protein
MFNFFTHRFSALTLTAILAACGGGGSDLSTDQTTKTTSLSGAVMDGYLTGASVCLDLNANLACDSGEPTTTSGTNGQYTLAVPVGTDTSNLHVIAIVDSKTIDADTGKAPEKSYTLMAPATAAGVVSPLTTLISHNKKQYPALTLDEATAATVADLSLPADTDLKQNYISTKNTNLHQVAQLTAALLGEAITGVVEAASPKTSDAKREAVLLGMDKAKERATAYAKKVFYMAKKEDLKATIAEAKGKITIDKTSTQESVASNVNEKNAPYADLASIFAEGVYDIQSFTLEYSAEKRPSYTEMTISILKLNKDKVPETTYYQFNGASGWNDIGTTDPTTKNFTFVNDSWTEAASTLSYEISSDGQSTTISSSTSTDAFAKLLYKVIDISGRSADKIPQFVAECKKEYNNEVCSYLQ